MLYETQWQAFGAFRYPPLSRRQQSFQPLSAILHHLYDVHVTLQEGKLACDKLLLCLPRPAMQHLHAQQCA